MGKEGIYAVSTEHGNAKMNRLVKITAGHRIDGKDVWVASSWYVPNGAPTDAEIREAGKLSAEIYGTALGKVKLFTNGRFSKPLRDSLMTFVSEEVSVR